MVRRIIWRFSSSWMTYQETTSTSSSGHLNILWGPLQWIETELHYHHTMFPGCQIPTISGFFLVKAFVSSTHPTASIGAPRYIEIHKVMILRRKDYEVLFMCSHSDYWVKEKLTTPYCISRLPLCYCCLAESEHRILVVYLELSKYTIRENMELKIIRNYVQSILVILVLCYIYK
jgi:hypothetical protein